MKLVSVLLPFALFLQPLAPVPALAAPTCQESEGSNICWDPEVGTYHVSLIDDPDTYIYGRCGGSNVVWKNLDFVTANDIHNSACPGEQLEAQ